MRIVFAALVAIAAAPTFAQQPAIAPPILTLRGVVTTANDVPLARVRVAAAPNQPPALTDERGRFTVPLPGTEMVRVMFIKAGYATFFVDFPRSELGARAGEEMRVRLSQAGAISGQVRDRSGASVMLASVSVRRVAPGAPAAPALNTTTNDLGEFRFGGLAPGAYAISAQPPAALLRGPGGLKSLPPAEEQTVSVSLGREVANVALAIDLPPDGGSVGAAPDQGPDATASLTGRVVNLEGRPIAGAVVIAFRAGAASRTAETDARGIYVIDRLVAGDYAVEARKHGYINRQYGQDRTGSSGRRASVQSGQALGSIDVTLVRGGAIAGTIVDEFGEPVEGASVNALELRVVAGRARALRAPASGGRTDDRGQYRLFGLQPGTYAVQAVVSGGVAAADGYLPLFYPGALSVDQASPTKVDLSVALRAIDFTLLPARAHRVRGTVIDPTGKPAAVGLVLMVSERSGAIQTEPAQARAGADGSFVFNNVAAGDYVVQAMASTPGPGPGGVTAAVSRQFATSFVTVTNTDPPPVTLKLSFGATLTGRVTYEGIASHPESGVSLIAVPADFDRGPIIGSGSTGFSLQPDGTFEYKGVFGPSLLMAQLRNPDWYVKSIMFKGQDLVDSSFDFGSDGTSSEIDIVISGAGATLTGRVTDDRAAAVRDYTVAVFATSRDKWMVRSRWVKTARPTQDGQFRVAGLPPGEYWIAAVDRLEGNEGSGDLQNPAVLESLSSRATRITLGEGQSQDLTLRLIRR